MTIFQVRICDSQVMQMNFTTQHHQQFTMITIDNDVLLQKIYRLQLHEKNPWGRGTEPNNTIYSWLSVASIRITTSTHSAHQCDKTHRRLP